MKKPERGGGFYKAAVLLVAAAAIESILANFVFFAYVAGANEVSDFTSGNPKFRFSECESGFSVEGLSFPVNSISFVVSDGERRLPEVEEIDLYVCDGAGREARLVKSDRVIVGAEKRRATFYLNSAGDAEKIEIRLSGKFSKKLRFSSATVNPRYRFNFNFERFCVIALFLTALRLLKIGAVRERLGKTTYAAAGTVAAGVCVACAAALWLLNASGENAGYIEYPLKTDVSFYSPYIQQLDAFMKGRASLDVEPSPELLALKNPYDPVCRKGIYYLFDRALYDGKYFSYFGIAPILLLYYPSLRIFGVLPPDSAATGVFGILTAIFLPLAVIELAKLSKRKISPKLAGVCGAGAYFASGTPIIQRGFTPFYYIASVAGAAFVSAFVFFVAGALNAKRPGTRIAFFALGGISFALGFLSRINSVVPAAIVLAAFVVIYGIKSLKNKRFSRFLADAAALGAPITAAVAFSLYYNKLRFDDPFQFGAKYQLTVADVSNYRLCASGIAPSIFYYFLEPFGLDRRFPYIRILNEALRPGGAAPYIDANFGLFAFPFMSALLLCPLFFLDKKTPGENKIFLGASIFSLFVTAFLDFCMGGVVFRYVCDVSIFASIICAVVLMNCVRAASEAGFGSAAKKGAAILAAVTAAVSLAFAVSFNPNLSSYSPKIYVSIKNFFDFWNGGAP